MLFFVEKDFNDRLNVSFPILSPKDICAICLRINRNAITLLENISVGNVDHILNRNSYVKSNQLGINQEDK